mmetsp:Transcript_117348/g.269583  ORF Transcript_117348/g.269583 Transcript_117348/m.269583 type:complete len:83 (-) Transcript_117348:88-336(-)
MSVVHDAVLPGAHLEPHLPLVVDDTALEGATFQDPWWGRRVDSGRDPRQLHLGSHGSLLSHLREVLRQRQRRFGSEDEESEG